MISPQAIAVICLVILVGATWSTGVELGRLNPLAEEGVEVLKQVLRALKTLEEAIGHEGALARYELSEIQKILTNRLPPSEHKADESLQGQLTRMLKESEDRR